MKRIIAIIVLLLFTATSFAGIQTGSRDNLSTKSAVLDTLKRGLIAQYKLNEIVGTDVIDSTGNNPATIASDISVMTSVGITKGAFDFDGEINYVTCGSDASLDDMTTFTYSAWINPTDTSGAYNMIVSKILYYGRGLWVNAGAQLTARAQFSGDNADATSGASLIKTNQWQHVVATFDTNLWRLYYNGEEISYTTQQVGTGAINSYAASNLNIGGSASGFFAGKIDNVMIYNNRALSGHEIRRLYRSGHGRED